MRTILIRSPRNEPLMPLMRRTSRASRVLFLPPAPSLAPASGAARFPTQINVFIKRVLGRKSFGARDDRDSLCITLLWTIELIDGSKEKETMLQRSWLCPSFCFSLMTQFSSSLIPTFPASKENASSKNILRRAIIFASNGLRQKNWFTLSLAFFYVPRLNIFHV